MQQYTNSSYYFMIFIIIGISALAAIPSMLKAFSKTSDSYIIEEMKRAQIDMMYYEMEHNNFNGACMGGEFILLQNNVFLESEGGGVSCTTNAAKTLLSMYTQLSTGETYCVDSGGMQGIVNHKLRPTGRCSN